MGCSSENGRDPSLAGEAGEPGARTHVVSSGEVKVLCNEVWRG